LTDEQLKLALREHAYLEGDFLLRSGKRSRYYLDKYRFETRPDILEQLGDRIARAVHDFELDTVGIGEKHRVISGHVVVFSRMVENLPAVCIDFMGDFIDQFTPIGLESDFADPYPGFAEKLGVVL